MLQKSKRLVSRAFLPRADRLGVGAELCFFKTNPIGRWRVLFQYAERAANLPHSIGAVNRRATHLDGDALDSLLGSFAGSKRANSLFCRNLGLTQGPMTSYSLVPIFSQDTSPELKWSQPATPVPILPSQTTNHRDRKGPQRPVNKRSYGTSAHKRILNNSCDFGISAAVPIPSGL